jgi:hypothetical protein
MVNMTIRICAHADIAVGAVVSFSAKHKNNLNALWLVTSHCVRIPGRTHYLIEGVRRGPADKASSYSHPESLVPKSDGIFYVCILLQQKNTIM